MHTITEDSGTGTILATLPVILTAEAPAAHNAYTQSLCEIVRSKARRIRFPSQLNLGVDIVLTAVPASVAVYVQGI